MKMDLLLALNRLQSYIESVNYTGYDPYDALLSPIFKLPLLKENKFIRFSTQQLVKRFPLNLRPILFVPKGINPVTLGLSIQAYAQLYQKDTSNGEVYIQKINALIDHLEQLIPSGFKGACWGYDFDWEARNAKIPAYQPTVVATGIITNALFIAHLATGLPKAKELVISAANFVLEDLNRSYEGTDFCFSYSPFDHQKVFNASMKGARILSQAYYFTKADTLRETAKSAINFVAKHQLNNGSWNYSLAKAGGWVDNYHTGYVLDCLHEYQKLTNDVEYSTCLKKGYNYYIENFLDGDGFPFFYNNNKYPLDCTAASQAILTYCRFGDNAMAHKVALYTINMMQKDNGSFRFRKFKHYTISTTFMRWSNAWMFAALSYLNLNS